MLFLIVYLISVVCPIVIVNSSICFFVVRPSCICFFVRPSCVCVCVLSVYLLLLPVHLFYHVSPFVFCVCPFVLSVGRFYLFSSCLCLHVYIRDTLTMTTIASTTATQKNLFHFGVTKVRISVVRFGVGSSQIGVACRVAWFWVGGRCGRTTGNVSVGKFVNMAQCLTMTIGRHVHTMFGARGQPYTQSRH